MSKNVPFEAQDKKRCGPERECTVFVLYKLRIIQRAVKSALFQQFLMGSLFSNLSVSDNKNGIRILDGG